MLSAIKAKFLGDGHESEVLRGAAVAFLLRGIGAALAFGLNVAVGRLLGAQGAGLYFLALSVITIAAVFAKIGLDASLLRFVASAAAVGDWARVKGVRKLGMRVGALTSLAVSLMIVVLAPQISDLIFKEPELAPVLRVMGAATFGVAMMMLNAESLKGLKRIAAAVSVYSVIFPTVALALIWPLTQRYGASGAAASYTLGVFASAVIGWTLWRNYLKPHVSVAPSFAWDELWQSCRPLWVMALVTKGILPWAALLILGAMAPAEDAGVYGAAARVAGLVTFILLTVNTVISPKFAELNAKGDIAGLERIARRFAAIVTLVASPLLLVLIFGGGFVMALFGPDFVRGGTALAILALGQAVSALCGSAGSLLIMTGHVQDVRNAALIGGTLLVVLALALIPIHGLLGAAIATAVSVAVMNLTYIILIKRRLGIFVLPIGRSK